MFPPMQPERTSFATAAASPAPRVTLLLGALAAAPGGPAGGARQQRRTAQHVAGRRLRALASASLGDGPGLTASVSHSGPWIAAGAGRGAAAIGVDVEQARPRQAARLAAYLGWHELAGGDRAGEDFAQLWTLWEAAVKCDGRSALDRTTPAFDALRPGFRAGRAGAWGSGGYHGWATRLADGAWLTLVVRSARPPLLDWRPLAAGGDGPAA